MVLKISNFKKLIIKKIKELESKKYINIYTITIFLFSLFMFSPLILNYIRGDDTTFHVANIYARGMSIENVFSKVLPLIGNDLGYGIGIFYPILPHMLGGFILNIISYIGFGEYAAIKLVKFIGLFSAAIFMYLLGSKLFKDKKKGLLTSLFYISSSYFCTDFYSRDALNESFIFIFMPLIFLGIYYLFCEKNKKLFYIYFVIGYAGMMYSHLVMSVWFTIVFILFLLMFVKDIFKKENLLHLIIAAILILIFTSPFTVPLVEHMLNGDYAIFNTKIPVLTETLDLKYFFIQIFRITGGHNRLYVALNIFVILLSVFAIYKIITKKVPTHRKKFIIGLLVFIIFSMILVSNDTFWHYTPDFLNNIQFPWRVASFVVFGSSLLAAEGLDVFCNLFKKKYIWTPYLLIIFIVISNIFYNIQNIQLVNYLPYSLNDGMGWQKEYLPMETLKKYEYFENRNPNKVISSDKNVKIEMISNDVPNMEFEVKKLKKSITLELPRLYYLGYKIVDEDGNNIKYFENENGFVSIKISENGKYYVTYPGTEANQIANVVCGLTIVVCVLIFIIKRKEVNS